MLPASVIQPQTVLRILIPSSVQRCGRQYAMFLSMQRRCLPMHVDRNLRETHQKYLMLPMYDLSQHEMS